MVDVITYSLKDDTGQSDCYYRDVSAFTDEVLAQAKDRVGPLVGFYQSHLEETGREAPRTAPEYAFELLALGVLWMVYAEAALDLAETPRRALTYLVRLRKRGGLLKLGGDLVRGVLAALFLSPDGHRQAEPRTLTLACLDRLLGWLTATDVFGEEAKRLGGWRDFLAGRSAEEVAAALTTAVEFATWFEARSEVVLGGYTPHVE